jgi:hypothetical protein
MFCPPVGWYRLRRRRGLLKNVFIRIKKGRKSLDVATQSYPGSYTVKCTIVYILYVRLLMIKSQFAKKCRIVILSIKAFMKNTRFDDIQKLPLPGSQE